MGKCTSRVKFAICVLALISGGCATTPSRQTCCESPDCPLSVIAAPQPIAQGADGPMTMALVFDPPVIQGEPPLDLSREPLQRGAFMGFEQVNVSSYSIRTDDNQTVGGWAGWGSGWGGSFGSFQRRATTFQAGTISR